MLPRPLPQLRQQHLGSLPRPPDRVPIVVITVLVTVPPPPPQNQRDGHQGARGNELGQHVHGRQAHVRHDGRRGTNGIRVPIPGRSGPPGSAGGGPGRSRGGRSRHNRRTFLSSWASMAAHPAAGTMRATAPQSPALTFHPLASRGPMGPIVPSGRVARTVRTVLSARSTCLSGSV